MGAQTFDLLGPYGSAMCDGSGVISGTAGGYGTATISDNQNGTVSVAASVNYLLPNTTYTIRLVQGNEDCNSFHMKFTSDEAGHGTVYWQEPTTGTFAFVVIKGIGATVYVTKTFRHAAGS